MIPVSIPGYPRIGQNRELKKVTEAYFQDKLTASALLEATAAQRLAQWQDLQNAGLDFIPSGDFSLYDGYLDTAFLINAVPRRYQDAGLSPLDTYFAMARGYQKGDRDIKALSMRKWFNTNYHYMVAELEDPAMLKLTGSQLFDHFQEALQHQIQTRPGLVGPFTFLKLARLSGKHSDYRDYIDAVLTVYRQILQRLSSMGARTVQLDEPILVTDLDEQDRQSFLSLYSRLLEGRGTLDISLQTYFGDIRDLYHDILGLDIAYLGLDFVEGTRTLELIRDQGLASHIRLIAGLVNGKNIWKNDYKISLDTLDALLPLVDTSRLILGTSCSLLHVPYTIAAETHMEPQYLKHLSFAREKLDELKELAWLSTQSEARLSSAYQDNQSLIREKAENPLWYSPEVRQSLAQLSDKDFRREPDFDTRIRIQRESLQLPKLPTTTIGSFPQTAELRRLRLSYKKGEITADDYRANIRSMIKDLIRWQEEVGLDVLVHGEYERNDMVEYFGEQMEGFLFTANGWVQSYGTRAVKPPIIFGDVSRPQPMTVEWIRYAQDLTSRPVKGMLTGPVTILNWSFPREDISRREICLQIALAIRAEVLDLEKAGIRIIQIDEAALREKLPLRREDWNSQYLDWAIPAFRLVHAGVQPATQIHTHMCYSEFGSIIRSLEDMDADVLSCEAARSDMELLDFLREQNYHPQVGPGLYDIHSPRVPDIAEFSRTIKTMVSKLPLDSLWINPDCGLKTRGVEETRVSLRNMVQAAQAMRTEL